MKKPVSERKHEGRENPVTEAAEHLVGVEMQGVHIHSFKTTRNGQVCVKCGFKPSL